MKNKYSKKTALKKLEASILSVAQFKKDLAEAKAKGDEAGVDVARQGYYLATWNRDNLLVNTDWKGYWKRPKATKAKK